MRAPTSFRFGLVLYEMATGQPAFGGGTAPVLSAAILHHEPRDPREVCGDVPTRLAEIILKSLEKDAADRYQTAADVRADLRRVRRELESGAAKVAAGERVSRARWAVVIVGAGLGIAALAGAAVYVPRSAASSGTRTTAASTAANDFQFEQLTSSGNASQPAISPDGRYVAYIQRDATQYSLWIRQTATPGNVQIVAPEPGRLLLTPTITPDGNFADFITGPFPQTELRRIPFLGGPQRTILERVHRPIGWSPDGKRFGFLRMNDARVRGRRGAALVVAAYDGSGERIVAYREDFARRQLAAVEVLVGLAIAAQRRPLERDSREEPARP